MEKWIFRHAAFVPEAIGSGELCGVFLWMLRRIIDRHAEKSEKTRRVALCDMLPVMRSF